MDYKQTISQAIEYIEANLKEDIGLAQVAKAVYFSPFHFSRVFSAMVGASVCEYVRKRRLTKAGNELWDTDTRVIDIAFDYGWESQEAFTRAFAKVYGDTPAHYRVSQCRHYYSQLPRLTEEALAHRIEGVISMEPKIVNLPEFSVVGMRDEVTLQTVTEKVPALWQRFNKRTCEIPHRIAPNVALGICEYCELPDFDEESPYHELTCVMVDKVEGVPEGMVARVIPASKYAVFTHKGSLSTLRETYDYIYKTWLPKSGFELAVHDDFEWYDERFGADNPSSQMDIYLPIK